MEFLKKLSGKCYYGPILYTLVLYLEAIQKQLYRSYSIKVISMQYFYSVEIYCQLCVRWVQGWCLLELAHVVL